MSSYELDKLVMLLSADWFFYHWQLIGIFTVDGTKSFVQKGCREIVKQIMSGATQYWETSFSEARVKETQAMLNALLKRSDLAEVTTSRITGLFLRPESFIDEGTRWLLVSMTEQLLDGAANAPQDATIIEALRREWNQWQKVDEIDFNKLCLTSATPWDLYLRNTTSDLPAMLADYVCAIASQSKFEVLWGFINVSLTVKQRHELLAWYRAKGQSLTGEPLRLPHEV
jgi:hypothetical protein